MLQAQSEERAKLQDYLDNLHKKIEEKDAAHQQSLAALEEKCANLVGDRNIFIHRFDRLENENRQAGAVFMKLTMSMKELEYTVSKLKEKAPK